MRLFELFSLYLRLTIKEVKNIKKALKILVIVLLGFLAIPATAFIILQNKQIQTYLAKKIATTVSENLEAEFSIESVDIIFFNRVVMKEVLLKDHRMDTLLHAPSMIATLKTLNRPERIINLSRLSLENATIRLATDTTRDVNIKVIIDALRNPPDSSRTEKWTVNFEAINLQKSKFILDHKFRYRDVPYGINFTDLHIGDMDLDIDGFRIANDTVVFKIEHLSFQERSGFNMDHLEAVVYLNKEFFLWRDVEFNTEITDVKAERIDFRFRQWKDFGQGDFFEKVKLSFRFQTSRFYLPDVAYFSRVFMHTNRTVRMSGGLRGTIASFKGDDLILAYGENSGFTGSFDMIGLPDFQETYMYFNIRDLTTSAMDIQSMQITDQSGEALSLSENLYELGTISYRGKYAGFYNDFVTYGSFTTDMGQISSDLSIRPDSAENVYFRGEISTSGFNLGRLADEEELVGKLSMQGKVEGISYHDGGLEARMDGSVSLLEFNGYPYKNMVLEGDLSNRMFDGSFSIADPNLRMDFFGKIDFNDTLPVFDFTASVDKAMLYPLKLAPTDPSYTLSCYLSANFIGARLDDFDGEIKLVNSLFQKQNKQIQIYDFNLFARHRPDSNQMTLRSDLVDAEITGTYEFEDIEKAAANLLAHHIPSFRNIIESPLEHTVSLNNFKYEIHFKNTFPITDFFYPDIEIERNSRLSGSYHPAAYEFYLMADFPRIRWKENSFKDLILNFSSDSAIAELESDATDLTAGSRIEMENLSLRAKASEDAFQYSLDWDNYNQQEQYMGSLSGQAAFEYRKRNILPRMDIQLNRGVMVMADTVWNIAPSHVHIDTSHISFKNFSISHQVQALSINGDVSEDPEDRLDVEFRNLDLAQFNKALNGLELDGTLNGTSTISGVYQNLVFLSDLSIDSLHINHELLGNTHVRTSWNDTEEKVEVDMEAMRGRLRTLGLSGDYFPEERRMDFDVTLDKLKLNIFQPVFAGIFSELEGMASGGIRLTGNLEKPLLNGMVSIQKSSFVLDYLQTKYSFSSPFELRDNNFILTDIEVFDEKGSRAILNGRIETNYMREPSFDLALLADNFRFLNTREVHNPQYYGDANASGRVALTGTPGNLELVISARTERGTHIFIPINQGMDIKEHNFITFVADGVELEEEIVEENFTEGLGGFILDFNLEITEDATTEIIFDPQVGDVLQGNGKGNIQLSIDPQNGFRIFGNYTIDRGEYLFTLQNIINKKLDIERGGTITWSGDPTSALININAIYNAKAAPGVLIPDPPEYLKKRMPVECHLIMEGNLLSPLISFDIILPTAEEETRNVVRNAITTDEELTKQFLSLLVINNFSSVATSSGGSTGGTGQMAGVTASELLSNQLSNWLSQISNDFDIGVNYRPGDEISSDQVEVALSTQIFDDRVSIHTNVDVNTGGNTTAAAGQNTSTIAGDFDVEVKLTDNGRFRLKAYNRYNHDQLYKTSPYTQGVGFVYREDFNSFAELGKRYADAITGKNRRKKKKAAESTTPEAHGEDPDAEIE
jgi:hypothetical protein